MRCVLPIRVPLLTLSALLSLAAQRDPNIKRLDGGPLTAAQIDGTVTQLLAAGHVTGAGIALFNHGRIAYLRAYGLRDTDKNLPLTPDSVMTSASLSKAAFATLVMRLVEEGTLDLDQPIQRYLPSALPDYRSYSDLRGDDRYRKLTLRILLSHSSGFPNWRAFEDDRKLKIHFEPGTRFAYSGEGIDLAQFVVETVTGQTLTALMREKLFTPLGMNRTSMVWETRFENDFANGYDEYGRSLGPERRAHPNAAGSMQTTLRDYSIFIAALLSKRFPNASSWAAMFHPQIGIHSAHEFPSLAAETSSANDAVHLSYGLGWGLYSTIHGPAFFKEGHDEGWRHLALCFPEGGAGILILTNSSNGEGIFKPLIDALLGPTLFPFDWERYTPYTDLPPIPKLKQHKEFPLTPTQLERFVGRYALAPQIVVSVTVENGHLFFRENDESKEELLPESANDFYARSSSDECSFRSADGAKAQSMVLHLPGKDVELKRIE